MLKFYDPVSDFMIFILYTIIQWGKKELTGIYSQNTNK